MKFYIYILFILLPVNFLFAQNNLNKKVSLDIKNESVFFALSELEKIGNFSFAYNSEIIPLDSLVTLNVNNTFVSDVLDTLLVGKYEYKDFSKHIILRPTPFKLKVIPEINFVKNTYLISGYVLDENTGKKIKDASVYVKKFMVSTLTDKHGYFKLKLKSESQPISITITKHLYQELSYNVLQHVIISTPDTNDYAIKKSSNLHKNIFAKLLLSYKQKVQNINLSNIFAGNAIQTSFIPGLSNRGLYSSQLINKISINVLGGYTGGVDGIEIGGIFNINRQDVSKLQLAGGLNLVGGSLVGKQFAGLSNFVLDSVKGLQAAGISNFTVKNFRGIQASSILNFCYGDFVGTQLTGIVNFNKKSFKGHQLAGITNVNFDTLTGSQLAGITNISLNNTKGLQIAGISNFCLDTIKGVQLASIINYSKVNKGLQVGLINITHYLEGYSVGLLNLSKNGFHQLRVSSNELTSGNFALKTGNARLFSLIKLGLGRIDSLKFYSYGFGLGTELYQFNNFSLANQLSFNKLKFNHAKVENFNIVKYGLELELKINKKVGFFISPSYNILLKQSSNSAVANFFTTRGIANHHFNQKTLGWIGYEFGIRIL